MTTRRDVPASVWLTAYAGLLVLLLCYNDTPLYRVGGAVLSPAFALLAPVVALGHLLRRRQGAWERGPIDHAVLLLLLWCNLIGAVSLLWYGMQGRYDYLGESFVGKFVKLNLYYGVLYIAYRHLRTVFDRLAIRHVAVAFSAVLVLHFGVLVIEILTMPNALNALHGGEQSYNRIRLLTPEASTSGSVVVLLVAAVFALRSALPPAWQRPILGVAIAFLTVYSIFGKSKGYLLVVGAALLAASVAHGIRKRSFLRVTAGLLVGAAATAILAPLALGNLEGVIRDTTTVVTRGALMLAALETFLRHPWGTGFGPHEYLLTDALPAALARLTDLLPEAANFLELDDYATSSRGLFPKSGLAELLLLGGLVGALAAWRAARHLWRLTGDQLWLRFALTFCLMSVATYMSILNKLDLVVLAVLIERLARESHPAANNRRITPA